MAEPIGRHTGERPEGFPQPHMDLGQPQARGCPGAGHFYFPGAFLGRKKGLGYL